MKQRNMLDGTQIDKPKDTWIIKPLCMFQINMFQPIKKKPFQNYIICALHYLNLKTHFYTLILSKYFGLYRSLNKTFEEETLN